MAGVITTGNHPAALWPGVHTIFGRAYEEHAKEYTDIFDVVRSRKNYEEDFLVTGFGQAAKKTEGASVAYDTESQGFTKRYTHDVYGLGYICTREEKEDGQYVEVSGRRAKALAFSVNQTIENVCANVYNRLTSGSYVGGDGAALGSTAHPSKAGNWSNLLNPGADLSEASLEDLIIQMMGATNDRGLQINLMPQSLHVARQEWFNANRILKSALQSDSANNDINVLKSTNAIPGGIKVNHYFSDADAFHLRTKLPSDSGMKMFLRRPVEFVQDNDFDTENLKAKSTIRFVPGWSDPRALYSSAGA